MNCFKIEQFSALLCFFSVGIQELKIKDLKLNCLLMSKKVRKTPKLVFQEFNKKLLEGFVFQFPRVLSSFH